MLGSPEEIYVAGSTLSPAIKKLDSSCLSAQLPYNHVSSPALFRIAQKEASYVERIREAFINTGYLVTFC